MSKPLRDCNRRRALSVSGYLLCWFVCLSACGDTYNSLDDEGATSGGPRAGDKPSEGTPPVSDLLTMRSGLPIASTWLDADVAFDNNAQLLTLDALKQEVMRATGQTWTMNGVEQWANVASAYGDADYATRFTDERVPTAQKLTIVRSMATAVCSAAASSSSAYAKLGGASVDVNATIADSPALQSAVAAIYENFFLVKPAQADVTISTKLLLDEQAKGGPKTAWTYLCVAYLTSINFLSD
jgi:hypothetical protein